MERYITSVDDCGQLDAVLFIHKSKSCQVDEIKNIQLSSSNVSSDLTRYFISILFFPITIYNIHYFNKWTCVLIRLLI